MPISSLFLDFIIFLPEFFYIATILILLIWSLFWDTTNKFKTVSYNLIFLLIELTTIVILLFLTNINKTKTIFYENLLIDSFSTNFKIIILIFTVIFLSLMYVYIKTENIYEFEFPILVVLTVFATLLLVSSYDLMMLYLSIEMQSLCLYILATFKKTSKFSSEGGIKYFILGAFSSSLLLFGMSLVYGTVGSTNYLDIVNFLLNYQANQLPTLIEIGFFFILVSFLFKLTAAPFHIWSPDVYEGAPLIVTVFFSTIPKLGILVVVSRLLFSIFFELYVIWQPLLSVVACLTMLIACLAALGQKKIKRFLAYSSISNIGYMLIGIISGTLGGLHAFFLYSLVYIITMFTLFSLILSIKKKNNKNLIYLTDLLFLTNIHPILRLSFIITLFSLAGIPPLVGFFSKFYIFFAAIEANQYFPVIVGILCSVLSAFYYIRIIKIINFEKKINFNYNKNQILSTNVAISIGGILMLCFFIIAPNFLILKTYQLALLI